MTVASDTRPRRRLRLLVIAGIALAVLAVFVAVWFQPQKLWIDDRVEEAAPRAPAPPSSTVVPARPELRGQFVSLDHGTTGVARVVDAGEGQRVVRLEGLDTSNGPDLFLYLTANRADGPEDKFDDDFVNLGRLRGNKGDQNYDVPAGVDLDRFATVLIWCDRFNSAFGAADLVRA